MRKFNQITHTVANRCFYININLKQGKTEYSFLQVVGKKNYVSMKKLNTPFISPGREFETFDLLQQSIKLPVLKSLALMAEVSLGDYIKMNCDVNSL